MGITYKIDTEAGIMFIEFEGKIGAADIQNLREQYTADPLYTPNIAQLHDGRIAKFSFSAEEARSLSVWGKYKRPIAKSAIVVDEESEIFAHMYVTYAGESKRVFRDLASAKEWLGLPSENNS